MSTFPRMHVSLYVSDLSKSVDFYTKFFGIEADKIQPKYAKYILEKPSLIISFIENKERVQGNFGHLGFQVETKEEVERLLEIARSQEIVSKEEIGVSCCYAEQDKFWVNDPDGVQWEVYYFHKDVQFNDPQYEQNDASACCMPPSISMEKPNLILNTNASNTKVACEPNSGCC